MKSSQTICFYFLCILIYSNALKPYKGFSEQPSCLKEYLLQLIKINGIYAYSVEACDDKDNINRRPPLGLDPEFELDQLKITSQETCLDLSACNLITDNHDFFQCHSKTAATNTHKFIIMHLNASSVAIELSEEHDEEKKEILRCQLSAKRKYIFDIYTAYTEHLKCLNSPK
ncbi:hypothetical protein FF38_12387 [Lucilia cuprina]|uniref:Protein TsetseEP domain-containing protein n=1 Tax=Lucilia cuprina TaxID=7375 RepID=A0A0L0CD10_LUCCU|nr:hypothetical protein CVS40_5082 [Lucilia cuprina]KNC30135.1 hypothetical protein FF38_12387 [Lucilia cuprina]